jgi:hypothetical protein
MPTLETPDDLVEFDRTERGAWTRTLDWFKRHIGHTG